MQILNKRFYNGIMPHWINRIKLRKLRTRLTEGKYEADYYKVDFEFPTEGYVYGLTKQLQMQLRVKGVYCKEVENQSSQWNFELSTGEKSKLGSDLEG